MSTITNTKDLTVEDITEDFVYDNMGSYVHIKDKEAFEKYQSIESRIVDSLATTLVAIIDALDMDRDIAYETARVRLGNKHAPKGEKWGTINATYFAGGGIKFVSCAGHGGFLISEARNRGIPEKLRREDASYEEDCDFWIVGLVYPENVAKLLNRWNKNLDPEDRYTVESVRKMAAVSVARWSTKQVRELIQEFYGR